MCINGFFMFHRFSLSSVFSKMLKSRDLPVFLMFLVISFIFWSLNALRKDRVANIKFPVVFINFPEDAMADPKTMDYVLLKVRSQGFHLLQYQLVNMFDPVEIKVDQLPPYHRGSEFGIYFLSRQFSRLFISQLPSQMELIELQSDTLFIPILPRKSKKVAVKPLLRLGFERQHMISSRIMIRPDSVVVSGFSQIVDTIRWISTELIEERNAKDTIERRIKLPQINGIQYNLNSVDVTIPIESFTQKSVNVPVSVISLPENYHFKSFPSNVQVSFLVGLSKFDKIFPDDFSAVVDFSTVGLTSERLKVKIEKTPEGIQNMSYSPIFVDYLIEKDR